jgi:hypothetical protein
MTPPVCGAAVLPRGRFLLLNVPATKLSNHSSIKMKIPRTPQILRSLAAVVGGFALFIGTTHAAPFLYAPGDLVLAFRQIGNASDYVVNIGKATNFSALPSGTTLPIANLSVAQLNSAFPSVNGLQWSVATANRPPLVPGFALQTIWITAPRLDANAQSAPWLRKGQFVQGTAAGQIDAIGVNAASASSSQTAGPDNTATGVVIPVSSQFALAPVIGDSGNLVGTFQGNVESLTAEDFDGDSANVSRSDLYELIPGTSAGGTLNTAGRYLGYFELKPDGSLAFHTGSTPPPAPNITAIGRTNNITTVSFSTVSTANYRLRAVNTLGSPVSSWPVVSGPVSGTGAILSLQDTNAASSRFFAVDAQP